MVLSTGVPTVAAPALVQALGPLNIDLIKNSNACSSILICNSMAEAQAGCAPLQG